MYIQTTHADPPAACHGIGCYRYFVFCRAFFDPLKLNLSDKIGIFGIFPKSHSGEKSFPLFLPEYKHVSLCRTMVFETTYYRAWCSACAGFAGPLKPRSSVSCAAPLFYSLFRQLTQNDCRNHRAHRRISSPRRNWNPLSASWDTTF